MARVIENPRELILSEAKKILYDEGYSSVSIRRVAKECNIAVGTIYNYFPTKKELIVEMMANYWEEFFLSIESIVSSKENFYVKLKNIFDNLAEFLKRFRKVWLSNEIYSSPDYIESGLERQNIYINKLIIIIEDLLKKEMCPHEDKNAKKLDAHKLAGFIIVNFVSIIQMPYLDYAFFESLLKKLIQ